MRSSFVVVALTAAAMLPTALRAQSAPRSEDLRTEIRRIVREELHQAMLELHGDAAAAHAGPRTGGSPQVVENIDVEVEKMNDLVAQIEKEVATNEKHLRQLGIAEPKSGGDGMQLQIGGDGGMHSFVFENGEVRAADGKEPKAKKAAKPKVKKPAKKKNKDQTEGDHPVELRLDGMQLQLEGAGEGMQLMLPGQSGQASGCNCGCPCCGGAKATAGNGEKAGQRVMILGEPKDGEHGAFTIHLQSGDDGDGDHAPKPSHSPFTIFGATPHGEAGKGHTEVRGKAGDDDDEEGEGEPVRKVAPAAKPGAPKAKAGQSHTILFGGSEHGEAGKGKADDDDDDDGEEVRKVAPPKLNPNPASGGSEASPRVLRLDRLLV